MTTLTINAASNSNSAILSMPSISSYGKKASTNNMITYTMVPKNWSRKATPRFSSFDWDVNMNELEFE